MSFRCAQCRVARWHGRATPKARSTSRGSPELERLAATHGLRLVTIRDIAACRLTRERVATEVAQAGVTDVAQAGVADVAQTGVTDVAQAGVAAVAQAGVTHVAQARLPSAFGEPGDFTVHAFRNPADGIEHLALVHTRNGAAMPGPHALVRVHSECVTGDALGSLRCDCGVQLRSALRRIAASESGVLVYLRGHEGRGIGLANKIRAYALQDRGLDTVEANTHLGFAPDGRDYAAGAGMLAALGVETLDLMTNNPAKIAALRHFGLDVRARVPIEVPSNPHNAGYLAAKRRKMGHAIDTKSADIVEGDVS